ncbi:MAG: hypothetical protein EOS23_31605 [Mesorhizobium sp.]|nr:MAG: hypothetical protein EOS23_31605 [Mesorhizobium sp.]
MAVPAIVFVARDAIGVAGVIAYWRRNEASVPKRARRRTSAAATSGSGAIATSEKATDRAGDSTNNAAE